MLTRLPRISLILIGINNYAEWINKGPEFKFKVSPSDFVSAKIIIIHVCKLVCWSIRIVPAGGNQMTPVVSVFGRLSDFSLHQCFEASRDDP